MPRAHPPSVPSPDDRMRGRVNPSPNSPSGTSNHSPQNWWDTIQNTQHTTQNGHATKRTQSSPQSGLCVRLIFGAWFLILVRVRVFHLGFQSALGSAEREVSHLGKKIPSSEISIVFCFLSTPLIVMQNKFRLGVERPTETNITGAGNVFGNVSPYFNFMTPSPSQSNIIFFCRQWMELFILKHGVP